MYIFHYNVSDKEVLVATLKTENHKQGIVTEYNSENNYINILFDDDSYAKSVPLAAIESIMPYPSNYINSKQQMEQYPSGEGDCLLNN